jgi:hypothetical protein
MRQSAKHLLAVSLAEAAPNRYEHVRTSARLERFERRNLSVKTVVSGLADGTGVEDDDIGLIVCGSGNVARGLQKASYALGVVLVHLASERMDDIAAHREPSRATLAA